MQAPRVWFSPTARSRRLWSATPRTSQVTPFPMTVSCWLPALSSARITIQSNCGTSRIGPFYGSCRVRSFLAHSTTSIFQPTIHSSRLPPKEHPQCGAFPMAPLLGILTAVGPTRFSPDGTLLVVALNPVRVYRTSDWLQVASLSDQNQALAFTADGQYLAVGGQSQIQFWRVSDWTLQLFYDQELGYPGRGVSSLAFSADGSRFAYGRMDAVVAVATNPFPPKASR